MVLWDGGWENDSSRALKSICILCTFHVRYVPLSSYKSKCKWKQQHLPSTRHYLYFEYNLFYIHANGHLSSWICILFSIHFSLDTRLYTNYSQIFNISHFLLYVTENSKIPINKVKEEAFDLHAKKISVSLACTTTLLFTIEMRGQSCMKRKHLKIF